MKFLLGLLILSLGLQVSAGPSRAVDRCAKEAGLFGGDGSAWPWGNETLFPWARIQGVWQPASQQCDSLFVFQVGKQNEGGERYIQIRQYDPVSCDTIASGIGYEHEKVIYASMRESQKSFDLTIRAFDDSVLKDSVTNGAIATQVTKPSVIVLTMYPKNKWDKRVSYRLEKISSEPALLCH